MCLPVLILVLVYFRPNQQQPATEIAIEKLIKTPYKNLSNNSVEECVICSEEFLENDLVIALTCGPSHIFHEKCIKTWLKINAVCPICRHPID